MRRRIKKNLIRIRKSIRNSQSHFGKVVQKVIKAKRKLKAPMSFDLDFSDEDFP